jgi:hypothetical protein
MRRGSLAVVLLVACNFRTNPLTAQSGDDGSAICQQPTSCDDGIACTKDAFDATACTCTHTPITAMVSGDGCCPSGATYATDHDCSASCGDGIVEPGETCDTAIASGSGACPTSCDDGMSCTTDTLVSGGTCNATCSHTTITQPINGDGCCPTGATGQDDNDCPAAYRITSLTLMDPHTFAGGAIGGCNDVTTITNNSAQNAIDHDQNNDGYFDDSTVIVFRPLLQTGGTTTPASLYFQAKCTTTATTCKPGSIASAALTASNLTSGTCLTPVSGSTKPYNPAVTDATGPCFSTGASNMTATILGATVSVQAAQIGGTYMGGPATGVMNGLYAAFVTQTVADSTNVLGTQKMSSFLPGGTGNCNMMSDKDTYNSTSGWWVYYNFTATAVPWTDQ